MVDMADLITDDRVFLDLKVTSKRQLFQELAQAASHSVGLEPAAVMAALVDRERLGTTGIGEGIAIPHAKVRSLGAIVGGFVRLAQPVDYDALDDAPVDLVFLLLAPEDAHGDQLKTLARIARLLRDPETCARLRSERNASRVRDLLIGREATRAA